MAVTRQHAARHTNLSRLIIGVSVLAAVIAIAPIIAAAFGVSSATVQPRTAFASAPSGNYVVVSRTEGNQDVIGVVWAENPGAVTELARVPHIEGMGTTGAVSPDGTRVAVVAVDSGTATRPVASLITVDLISGELFRAALRIDPDQRPVWAPDGKSVVVTRTTRGDDSGSDVQVLRVALRGTEDVLWTARGVLGVYPVGFEPSGALLAVTIDGEGSMLVRDGSGLLQISGSFTRDWQLSPDGTELAFIEADLTDGLRYLARRVSFAGGAASAQSLMADVPALGAAWNPVTGSVEFGIEPGGASEGVSVQALRDSAGFDVPLGFAPDGSALAVTHWSGEDFTRPGAPAIQVVDGGNRASIEGYTRFLGWARR